MRRLAPLLVLFPVVAAAAESAKPDRWADDMKRFEALDREHPFPDGGVVFTGSSSIRLWKLDESFPELKPLNRGFGGSESSDVVRHLDLLVLKHKPRAVVFYSGDNDLANGKSPETVAADITKFVDGVHAKLPETKILLIPPKPSVKRWGIADKIKDANARIAAIAKGRKNVEFIDIWPLMLGDDGKPKPDLFVEDGLHMNAAGYRIWTAEVKKHLE